MVVHVDDLTKKQNGIICDLCNNVSIDKFEYYNAKLDLVEVDRAAGTNGIKNIDRRWLDLDICQKCMDEIIVKVKASIEQRAIKKPSSDIKQWTTSFRK